MIEMAVFVMLLMPIVIVVVTMKAVTHYLFILSATTL